MLVTGAARALGDVELERGVALGGALDGLDGGARERCAAEVGVDDDAGGVDDAYERGFEAAAAGEQQVDRVLDRFAAPDLVALFVEHLAGEVRDRLASVGVSEGGNAAIGEQRVDGGQRAVGVGHGRPRLGVDCSRSGDRWRRLGGADRAKSPDGAVCVDRTHRERTIAFHRWPVGPPRSIGPSLGGSS